MKPRAADAAHRLGRSPRRVVYVEGNVDGTIGGSYFSLLYLASGVDRSRFEPIVVFATDNGLIPRFVEQGIKVIVRPPPRAIRAPGALGRLVSKGCNFAVGVALEPLRLAQFIRELRADLVHLNNGIVRNHSWMIAARIAGVPCLTHERGIIDRFSTTDRVLARSLQAVICISAAVERGLRAQGLDHLRLVRIHNGLDAAAMRPTRSSADVRDELGVAPGSPVIGIVGNIKAWKGQSIVVEAMARLQARWPGLVCLLIGDVPREDASYKATIERRIAELGLQRHVLITGFRSDVANYVNALDVLVHASVRPEPFGRVLLEAMALSKPVVASADGGVTEIVEPRKTGLLFRPGDADALAAGVDELLSNPDRAVSMGRAGRERLDVQFSLARNVESTQTLYDEILG